MSSIVKESYKIHPGMDNPLDSERAAEEAGSPPYLLLTCININDENDCALGVRMEILKKLAPDSLLVNKNVLSRHWGHGAITCERHRTGMKFVPGNWTASQGEYCWTIFSRKDSTKVLKELRAALSVRWNREVKVHVPDLEADGSVPVDKLTSI